MRLACAAAEKNILEFFVRWGMTPDAKTKEYAAQFNKEERAIYYINDAAREYRVTDGTSIADSVKVSVTAKQDEKEPNRVTLTMEASAEDGSDIGKDLFGYEITRIQRRYGKEERQVVGFTQTDTFTDVIGSVNNRVVGYEVRGIDWCMEPTKPGRLEDEIQISHDGSMDKSGWKITVNTWSKEDEEVTGEDEGNLSCSDTISSAKTMIDNDRSTVYDGTVRKTEDADASRTEDAQAVISLGRTETIAGLKYTYEGDSPIEKYTISISDDGSDWTEIKSGTFRLENGTATVYFDKENDSRYNVYDAAYVRLTADGSDRFAAAELDLLAPVGDKVELDQIGILAEDAVFEHSGNNSSGDTESGKTIIPEKSIVFTGRYKGNPAYNMVLLYDASGSAVGGKDSTGAIVADQLILAPDPKDGQLGEITEGTWIYYIRPEDQNSLTLPDKVRAELYRTQDAQTNDKDRLVSDTKLISVPESLPEITITSQP